MKRHKHALSHYRLTTMDMGKLIPVGCFEVLPGDTVQHATSCLLRCSPLLTPVMHPCVVRLHHWFVPNRLVWDEWEDFITGGPDGMNASVVPSLDGGGTGFAAGSLPDHLGVPPLVPNLVVSALAVRGYNLIFNEYYRDQDLIGEVPEDSVGIQRVAWGKDYFTTARPWTQKGPQVTLPLGTTAPVTIGTVSEANAPNTAMGALYANQASGSPAGGMFASSPLAGSSSDQVVLGGAADLSQATAVDVNTVRRAFALQRYEEARALYGSRYTEYLRYLGVRSSDARLQRPEYLGGGKQTISFSEVLQTGESATGSSVGTMFGHGIAAVRSNRYRRFFEEHGHVLTLMSVRPRSIYVNGRHRMFTRGTKEDYWQKELELIGQQEVYRGEVFADGTATDLDVFGYQDRYSEYRTIPSTVSGEFRTILNQWHLAREFASAPVLNASFVTCDPTKRVFQVPSTDVLWNMVNHSIQARRMVRTSTVGAIV